MSHNMILAVLLLAPLVGFLINGFMFRRHHGAAIAGTIATGAAGLSFLCSAVLFMDLVRMPQESRAISVKFFEWVSVAGLNVPAGFVIDQISGLMILIVTGVGSLIHLFSIGYMGHDERPF
ncbi:MAG: hypothetical protein ABL958_21875 [Bdellovibrionia bacterium]